MKMSELIASYGDERLEFQNLDQSTIELNLRKGFTEIKFGTSQPFDINGTRKLGLVLWLDRDAVKQIMGQSSPQSEKQPDREG